MGFEVGERLGLDRPRYHTKGCPPRFPKTPVS